TETIPTKFCTLSLKARDRITFAGTGFAAGYTLGRSSLPDTRRPLTLGVLTGTRGSYCGNRLHASGGALHGKQATVGVFKSFAGADPLIGIRWELPLHDLVWLNFRGTTGGFGASSDLIWGLTGTARFWIPWKPVAPAHPYIDLGYRVADFDRSNE